jgi:rhodanese-related sulfurtransferase
MAKFRNKKVDVVIDVRSHLSTGWHLPGAMPVGSIEQAITGPGSRTTRTSVYCAAGAIGDAADTLRRMGYRRVVDGGGYGEARQQFDEG